MDDYYAIVGVDRNASREEIDHAIRKQLRLWQRRAGSADLTRRHEAERRVRRLSEARAVLLDEQQRLRYDRRMDAHRPPPRPVPPPVLDRMPPPLPDPPPVAMSPADLRGSGHYMEYRHEPAWRRFLRVTVGLALLALGLVLLGIDGLGSIALVLIAFSALIPPLLRARGPALMLGEWGVAVTGEVPQSAPWEQVRVIQAAEVDGVWRVRIVTTAGVHILAPAPRGGRMSVPRRRFDRQLAEMQRFHERGPLGWE